MTKVSLLSQLPSSVVNGSNAQATPGLWLPPDWGQFWKPKRDAAGSGKAVVAVLADSTSRFFSSNIDTKGWAGLLRTSLQSSYGDGGFGFKSNSDNAPTFMNSLGIAAGVQTNYASQQVTQTGSWAVAAGTIGPGLSMLTSSTNGSTLTYTGIRGSTIKVWYALSGGGGILNVTIDGNAQTAINTAGAAAIASASYSVGAGTHTVVITQSGTTQSYHMGVSGENATGVVLNNFSRYGANASNYNNTDSYTSSAAANGGATYPADLVIYALGANDANTATAADTWSQNVARYLNTIRAVNSPTTDVLIVLPHIGKFDNATPTYHGYLSRARGLAEAYGAALLDLWRLGRNSWEHWNSLNRWSDSSGTGASGTDVVHPGDTGHQYIANQLSPILTAA